MSDHPYLVFFVTSLALLMASVDGTIVNVGLRTMQSELHTNIALLGWTLTGYTLTQTIAMPLAGKLSDEWGRKRLFLGAVLIFTLSSVAAGLAPNVQLLIVFRVFQAIGGGAFLPSATGIVSDAFGEKRGTAIGLFTSIFPLGGIIGPNLGGVPARPHQLALDLLRERADRDPAARAGRLRTPELEDRRRREALRGRDGRELFRCLDARRALRHDGAREQPERDE